MMDQARPLPLPKADPDAVRQQGRMEAQSGARSGLMRAHGSTPAFEPPH
jgi:hypothetical protein